VSPLFAFLIGLMLAEPSNGRFPLPRPTGPRRRRPSSPTPAPTPPTPPPVVQTPTGPVTAVPTPSVIIPASFPPAPPVFAPAPRAAPAPVFAAPWPQVVPAGLPAFPGPGWVPDEPPPSAVVSRANTLLPQLWRGGPGTFKTEQTAGRWITYRATQMGTKRGVVAFRLREQPRQSAPVLMPPMVVTPGPTVFASAPSSAPATASTALPTLRRGSKGDDVRLVQRELGITADGDFGPKTEAAVRAYQAANGLTIDGVVGKQTWASLLG
jgi:hypothetical protein